MVMNPGMCTASFEQVEQDTGVPIFRGPKHAANIALILPMLDSISLSRTIPADEFLAEKKPVNKIHLLEAREMDAGFDCMIRGLKIEGDARMKVLAEVMDAHNREDIREIVLQEYFRDGADVVDLGFGFDATPGDVAPACSPVWMGSISRSPPTHRTQT